MSHPLSPIECDFPEPLPLSQQARVETREQHEAAVVLVREIREKMKNPRYWRMDGSFEAYVEREHGVINEARAVFINAELKQKGYTTSWEDYHTSFCIFISFTPPRA